MMVSMVSLNTSIIIILSICGISVSEQSDTTPTWIQMILPKFLWSVLDYAVTTLKSLIPIFIKKPIPTHYALSCVMFKTYGCNMECAIIGIAYNQKVTGSCTDSDSCKCIIPETTNLDSLWSMKFDDTSKDVLKEIKSDSQLEKIVNIVLRKPFKTPKETKERLKSILNDDQYQKLHTKECYASRLLKDGKLDLFFVKLYVINVPSCN